MIYCVEDEDSIRNLMTYALEASGFTAKGFPDSVEFFKAVAEEKPDLVLLDIMLPGKDGLEILRALRSDPATAKIPVIMASARGTEFDKVTGLDLGADDYLAKPFDLDELEARLRALLRRSQDSFTPKSAHESMQIGAIRYEKESGAIYLHDEIFELTPRELAMMHALLARPGHAVAKERLFSLVFPGETDVQYEAVEVVAYRLRKKLTGTGLQLVTLRGLGYLIKAEAAA